MPKSQIKSSWVQVLAPSPIQLLVNVAVDDVRRQDTVTCEEDPEGVHNSSPELAVLVICGLSQQIEDGFTHSLSPSLSDVKLLRQRQRLLEKTFLGFCH